MSEAFAVGARAWALCDRCGQRYFLRELKRQMIDQKDSGLLVCPECMDIDHEQLRLGKTPIYDPQALRNPRPDQRNDVTVIPIFTGTYTLNGAPIFTTIITPSSGSVAAAGAQGTIRRT